MTIVRRRRWLIGLGVIASGAFAVLAHASMIDGVPPGVGAFLSLVPLAGVVAWRAGAARSPLFTAIAVSLAAAALWWGWSALERHFSDLFFLEHAGVNLVLAIAFGRTLAPGHEPLCTRFARMLHDRLPAEVERYTRQVTVAWTAFFVVLFIASCTLYLAGALAAWSLLANILSPVLIATMFAAEYAIRLRALPDWERVGVLSGIRAFSRHVAAGRAQAPR